MITSGQLYEWSDELKDADADRLRVIARELIDGYHLVRSLVEQMAAFRNTAEHDRMMASLDRINKALQGHRTAKAGVKRKR